MRVYGLKLDSIGISNKTVWSPGIVPVYGTTVCMHSIEDSRQGTRTSRDIGRYRSIGDRALQTILMRLRIDVELDASGQAREREGIRICA